MPLRNTEPNQLKVLSKRSCIRGVQKQYSKDDTSKFQLRGNTIDVACGKTIYTTGIFLSPDKDTAAALRGVCEN